MLARFGTTYTAAKAERAAVDFEDLELRARDLLNDPATRERWAERFALIMVDEFQDTNAVQLGILEALERENLFAVGDEFQSIYRFRHADVGIFRRRAEGVVRRLAVNFRSREELLDVLNVAFAAEFGERFAPLRAGRRETPMDPDGALRLFALDPPAGDPPVELLITDTQDWDESVGLAGGGDQPWRRAEARLIADRLRTELDAGRRAGDMVVLVRATASLRLLEEALEEQGLPTYVVGGRGYWSQEQVRDGLAWLRVLANPHDEEALLTVLSSPFCGADTDALVLLATAGRAHGSLWTALQEGAAERAGESPGRGEDPPDGGAADGRGRAERGRRATRGAHRRGGRRDVAAHGRGGARRGGYARRHATRRHAAAHGRRRTAAAHARRRTARRRTARTTRATWATSCGAVPRKAAPRGTAASGAAPKTAAPRGTAARRRPAGAVPTRDGAGGTPAARGGAGSERAGRGDGRCGRGERAAASGGAGAGERAAATGGAARGAPKPSSRACPGRSGSPRSRGCSRPSASTRSGRRWRSCSSGRSSRPAMTSRCSRGPGGTGGSRTCAS